MAQLPLLLATLVALISRFSAGQAVTSTDTSPSDYSGTIQWVVSGSSNFPRNPDGTLLPLKKEAGDKLSDSGLKGPAIFPTAVDTSLNVQLDDIVFIQCDDPSNSSDPTNIFQSSIQRNPQAVILYSNISNYCSYTPGDFDSGFNFIFTMTSSRDYVVLNDTMNAAGSRMNAMIARNTTFANMASQSNHDQNPSNTSAGPSPSTAVAMIILYSITGVITALFLIIIITGAIRAHRHPERYGPRNVLGRPRQSRARGLGRAILDTIPIVKFGEKDEPKPGDVEMAAAAGEGQATRSESPNAAHDTTMTRAATNEDDTTGSITNITAAATPSPSPGPEEENQSCSICTEDFEKGDDVRVLPCKHCYHPACIDPWLLNVSGTCPLCRTDLRPTTSRTSDHLSVSEAASTRRPSFAPPLDSENGDSSAPAGPSSSRASRRLSAFFDILNPRRMESASPQERIAALRRLREANRASPEDELETRRRRRLTARLHDTFHISTRARGTESPPAEPTVLEASAGAEEEAEFEMAASRSNISFAEARGASPARSATSGTSRTSNRRRQGTSPSPGST